MRSAKSTLAFLALVAAGTLAMAQQAVKAVPERVLTAVEMDKLAGTPSIEQTIFLAAADKLRKERKPVTSIELQLKTTIKLTTINCYQICVGTGIRRACIDRCYNNQ